MRTMNMPDALRAAKDRGARVRPVEWGRRMDREDTSKYARLYWFGWARLDPADEDEYVGVYSVARASTSSAPFYDGRVFLSAADIFGEWEEV
jgi:hypothetical protein